MIDINFLNPKKPRISSAASQNQFNSFSVLLKRWGTPLLLALLSFLGMDFFKQTQLKKEDQRFQELKKKERETNSQRQELEAVLQKNKKMREAHIQQNQENEFLKKIFLNQKIYPQVFEALTEQLPAEGWIEKIQLSSSEWILEGGTTEVSTLSPFLQNLIKQPIFHGLEWVHSEKKEDLQLGEIARFEFRKRDP